MRIKNRESKNVDADSLQQGPQVFMFEQNQDMFKDYTAVCFFDQFPIELHKSKLLQLKNDENEEKKLGFDPNAINLKLPELVRFVHGSLESKQKLIDDFNEAHPECSKNSIEKKLKENFDKDKRNDDPK